MMKREYRGQRSVAAIADFIRQQQVDPVKELHSLEEVKGLDVSGKNTPCWKNKNLWFVKSDCFYFVIGQRSKRNIIGYFEKKDSDNYHTYEKVANILRDDCTFLAAFGWVTTPPLDLCGVYIEFPGLRVFFCLYLLL